MDSLLREVARTDAPPPPARPAFPGNQRFRVEERLGQGAYGVVYRAFDQERKRVVALKTLRRSDPELVYRFKREFRALADVVHPNLVELLELFADGEDCYFSMEYVEGKDFLSWVRPGGTLDEARLRDALGQLAAGLATIHRAGKLHRDVKPSNVVVTGAGRVVLLDFGLATEREATLQSVTDLGLAGTPAYLAPEIVAGLPPTPACDWYAVGVMLFEALTGKLPFEGTPLELLQKKGQGDAPEASSLTRVPPDLDRLCRALLQRDPAQRADVRAVMQTVEVRKAVQVTAEAPRTLFVGRSGELAALREAAVASRRGPVVAHVSGISGMGKTTLVQRALEDLKASEHAVVLPGRCYERESIPYKALDTLVDALSRHLGNLGPKAEPLLPRGARILARIFPVLGRTEVFERAPVQPEPSDPQELRRRGLAALKELLARVADRSPLVLWIDDAQWGDAEGAAQHARGRSEEAARNLLVAEQLLGADGKLRGICARRRRGEVMGGSEGRALIAEADAWMIARGVKDPERFADVYSPRFAPS